MAAAVTFFRRNLWLGGALGNQVVTMPRSPNPYRLHALTFQIVTSATIANRGIYLQLLSGSIVVALAPANISLVASRTLLASFTECGAAAVAPGVGSVNFASYPLPIGGFRVTPDLTLQLVIFTGQVDDVLTDIMLTMTDELPAA